MNRTFTILTLAASVMSGTFALAADKPDAKPAKTAPKGHVAAAPGHHGRRRHHIKRRHRRARKHIILQRRGHHGRR